MLLSLIRENLRRGRARSAFRHQVALRPPAQFLLGLIVERSDGEDGRARDIVLVTNHDIATGSQEQRDECAEISTEVVVAPEELVNISAIGRGTGNAHAAVLQRMLRGCISPR